MMNNTTLQQSLAKSYTFISVSCFTNLDQPICEVLSCERFWIYFQMIAMIL